MLENLPQVFSHFDCQRRNLIVRTGNNQQNQLVVLDWQQCGIGAIGAELSWLLLEWPLFDLPKLSEVVFHSYVKGLQESGWSGDADIACLGYKAMLAVFIGCAFPALMAFLCSAENREFALQILGSAEESLFWQELPVLDFTLDCADEALVLIKKLGLRI